MIFPFLEEPFLYYDEILSKSWMFLGVFRLTDFLPIYLAASDVPAIID